MGDHAQPPTIFGALGELIDLRNRIERAATRLRDEVEGARLAIDRDDGTQYEALANALSVLQGLQELIGESSHPNPAQLGLGCCDASSALVDEQQLSRAGLAELGSEKSKRALAERDLAEAEAEADDWREKHHHMRDLATGSQAAAEAFKRERDEARALAIALWPATGGEGTDVLEDYTDQPPEWLTQAVASATDRGWG